MKNSQHEIKIIFTSFESLNQIYCGAAATYVVAVENHVWKTARFHANGKTSANRPFVCIEL